MEDVCQQHPPKPGTVRHRPPAFLQYLRTFAFEKGYYHTVSAAGERCSEDAMVGPSSSNIYVSATKEDQEQSGPENPDHYRKPQKTWLISVEPHKHSIPFVPRHDHDAVHFVATGLGGEGAYAVKEHSKDGVIGAILVAEAVHHDSNFVRKTIEESLQSPSSSSVPSESLVADGQSDHWIRRALHALQDKAVVERFDVGEFMTFAHVSSLSLVEEG